jgi:hypothetical protein
MSVKIDRFEFVSKRNEREFIWSGVTNAATVCGNRRIAWQVLRRNDRDEIAGW